MYQSRSLRKKTPANKILTDSHSFTVTHPRTVQILLIQSHFTQSHTCSPTSVSRCTQGGRILPVVFRIAVNNRCYFLSFVHWHRVILWDNVSHHITGNRAHRSSGSSTASSYSGVKVDHRKKKKKHLLIMRHRLS